MIDTQPNERLCAHIESEHILGLPACCPISKNPGPGSTIAIRYTPVDTFLEVASLKRYIDSYVGGKGAVRSMEGMIQAIAQDCSDVVRVEVEVLARLNIAPEQQMTLVCVAKPRPNRGLPG
jgi:NADPH-dependent 7-cyano-7-deazaguanine reductase QueF